MYDPYFRHCDRTGVHASNRPEKLGMCLCSADLYVEEHEILQSSHIKKCGSPTVPSAECVFLLVAPRFVLMLLLAPMVLRNDLYCVSKQL